MTRIFGGHLHCGLSNVHLTVDSVELGQGVVLSKTYAHLMSPYLLAFKQPSRGKSHPGPWKAASGGKGFDIDAELFVPENVGKAHEGTAGVARVILFLMRLWVNPAITLPVFASHSFREIEQLASEAAGVFPFETGTRYFPLGVANRSAPPEAFEWIARYWETTSHLMKESETFSLAVDALDSGQFIENHGLALISLWAALESLFSPSHTELKFRVSALIATFLEEPGTVRALLQKEVAKLYDKRSAAAHGKPSDESGELLASFSLLRRVLIKVIEQEKVPKIADLEAALFGV